MYYMFLCALLSAGLFAGTGEVVAASTVDRGVPCLQALDAKRFGEEPDFASRATVCTHYYCSKIDTLTKENARHCEAIHKLQQREAALHLELSKAHVGEQIFSCESELPSVVVQRCTEEFLGVLRRSLGGSFESLPQLRLNMHCEIEQAKERVLSGFATHSAACTEGDALCCDKEVRDLDGDDELRLFVDEHFSGLEESTIVLLDLQRHEGGGGIAENALSALAMANQKVHELEQQEASRKKHSWLKRCEEVVITGVAVNLLEILCSPARRKELFGAKQKPAAVKTKPSKSRAFTKGRFWGGLGVGALVLAHRLLLANKK